MKVKQVNHVSIHVADVEASVRFYRDVMQFEPLARPNFDFPGAWFRLGDSQQLHIIGNRIEPVYAGHRSNHYALTVDDIDAWELHLRRHGVSLQVRKHRADGASQIFFPDPDGHMIELCTPPHAN